MTALNTLVLRRIQSKTFALSTPAPPWLTQIAVQHEEHVLFDRDPVEDPLVDFLGDAHRVWSGKKEPARSEPMTYGDRSSELIIEAIACCVGNLELLVITPWCENRKSRLRSAREGALRAETLELLQEEWRVRESSLQESNKALERFARAASHDLRAPLRTMRGFAEILAEEHHDQLDGRANEFLSFISESAGNLSRLIERLLEFAHAQDARIVHTSVDTTDVVRQVLADLEDLAGQSEAVVTVDPLPPTVIDETLLRTVVQNLLENAMKFSREGSQPVVQVTGSVDDTEVTICVKDNGIGIPEGQQERVFEPFERLSSSSLRPGHGLGLALARESVERWGGRLAVTPQRPHGSCFCFTIPVVDKTCAQGPSVCTRQ